MNKMDYLIRITAKNKKNKRIKLNLPENKDFTQNLKNIKQDGYKITSIYSNCGLKILDNKGNIVGINNHEYLNKDINCLNFEELTSFVTTLNEKLKILSSISTKFQIAILSEFISTNIDTITDFLKNGNYTFFEDKTLKEIAFEKEKIQGKEEFELQYLMNSLGYFQVPSAVVKFDIEQVHLEENILISYLEYIYYNTKFRIQDNKYVCIELAEKTLQLEFNIQKMFDNYMGFELKEKDEKNIRKEIECYRETFERKYDLIETDYVLDDYLEYECKHNFIENKLNDLIYYREDIQKNMMDRIEYYYNNEDWYGDMEPSIDRSKSFKEIQEELQTTFFKEMIDAFILSEFNLWYEYWIM